MTDGIATKALPAFTIKLVQATSTASSVTLSRVPPTLNVDGTTLTNLAGFEISYGLAPATWYFAIKAVTSSGTRSDLSTQVSKAVL